MRRTLSAPSRESGREATAFGAASCAPAELSEPVNPFHTASVTTALPRSSSLPLPFSPRRGRPAAASEIRLGVIEQPTRPSGDGFPIQSPSIGDPSGRRVHRPAGSVPVGTTKER